SGSVEDCPCISRTLTSTYPLFFPKRSGSFGGPYKSTNTMEAMPRANTVATYRPGGHMRWRSLEGCGGRRLRRGDDGSPLE
ncbi:hypothetical protein BHE74_00058786, partial [Ensete ventricosum]